MAIPVPIATIVALGSGAGAELSGLSALTGYGGGPPMHAGFSYADPNAGVHGAFAVMAAFIIATTTGEGQYIDMSQWECAMDVLPEGILEYTMNGREPERIGNRDPLMSPHGIFKCLDRPEKIADVTIDQWVAIAAPMTTSGAGWRTRSAVISSPMTRALRPWLHARETRMRSKRSSLSGPRSDA